MSDIKTEIELNDENPLLYLLKTCTHVPIPQSTETDKTYWFINNGTISESPDAIVINASDPVTNNPIGSIAYVIHNGFVDRNNVQWLSDQYSRHPHVITIHEWQAAMNAWKDGVMEWDLCLTPIKVLGKVQEGYR